jgi:hypothetical protein
VKEGSSAGEVEEEMGKGCIAGLERVVDGLLGGRGLCCWLGRRGGQWMHCWVGDARWKRAVLLAR